MCIRHLDAFSGINKFNFCNFFSWIIFKIAIGFNQTNNAHIIFCPLVLMGLLKPDKSHFVYSHIRLFFHFSTNSDPDIFIIFDAAAGKIPMTF